MPQKYVAIDKPMVKSRHRSGFRQFIKDKPTKWGIKLWVLADSSNGYTVDFNTYISRAAGQTIGEHGHDGYDVVRHLTAPYQILSALSTQWKCVRWWKTLFFPLIDIAVVNSFILFQAHRAEHTEIERPAGYLHM